MRESHQYIEANVSDRYISNIEMPGGKIRYVPLHPPKDGAQKTSSASNWTIDFDELEKTINEKTKMIVRIYCLQYSYLC